MVIDGHCHIFPASFQRRRDELVRRDATFATLFSNPKAVLATSETLLESMDRDGVARSIIMGIGWSDLRLAQESNDYIAESVQRYPDRLTGFCCVNPRWGDAAVAEMERCAAAGLKGVGEIHPDTQGLDITDGPLMAPFMKAAARLGMPVLVHASEPVGHLYPGKGQTTPDKLCRFIENFPENVIICAHWGGGLPFYALMPEVGQALQNVYYDTAASLFLYKQDIFGVAAQLVGPDKILFATDYPLISPRRLLAQVEASGLEAGDQALILGGNAVRLFGIQEADA
jgi:predicted TIM-barrel fold metal-dependent hydrolase